MATLLAASIGTGIVGALVTGWLKQRNGDDAQWDPNRFSLDGDAAIVEEQPPAPRPVVLSQQPATPAKKQPSKAAEEPKLSSDGMSALAMLGTKFGAVHVNPQSNVSFRTREMETPDQARMNSEVLQDLNDLEFIVGADETLTCPFQNMVTLQHQEAPMLLGGASTPSMERLLRQKLSTSKNNVAKLKGLGGCAVNVKRLGNYVVASHLPGGDGVISKDGKTLVLNKGLRAGKDNDIVRLKAGDTVAIAPDNRAVDGGFSMYKCYTGTNRAEPGDSQKTCLSQTIESVDRDAQEKSQRTLYMNRQGRNRFKDFLRHRYQRIDEVQAPPNLERPDVYAKDVARIRRDGFAQKAGTKNPYMDQAEIDAMNKKNTVRLASGEVVQTSASKAFSTPLGTSRTSIALAADSHYGTMTKLVAKTDTVKAHAAAADPIRDQERYERMRQAQGDLRTNRPRGYVDKSGLKQYNPKYLETEQPREQDLRVAKEPAVLSVNQTLNPAKRGGGREEHHNGFAQAKAERARETSHRQAGGYMDGGLVVHELTTSTALQARVPADKNVRRKEKPYRQILNGHQSAAQDSGNTVDKNLRIYGDAHKPVVRLNRLVRIPGVMAKRGVGDTDLYDASRPHKVRPRIDRKKDANSKKGVRRDYGHYTNQFLADDPHQSNVRTNAIDARGQSYAQEFGRQTGAARPTSRTSTRTGNRRTTSRTRSSPTSPPERRCERATTPRKRRTTSTSTSSRAPPPCAKRPTQSAWATRAPTRTFEGVARCGAARHTAPRRRGRGGGRKDSQDQCPVQPASGEGGHQPPRRDGERPAEHVQGRHRDGDEPKPDRRPESGPVPDDQRHGRPAPTRVRRASPWHRGPTKRRPVHRSHRRHGRKRHCAQKAGHRKGPPRVLRCWRARIERHNRARQTERKVRGDDGLRGAQLMELPEKKAKPQTQRSAKPCASSRTARPTWRTGPS